MLKPSGRRYGNVQKLWSLLLNRMLLFMVVGWPGARGNKANFCQHGWCLQHGEPGSARGDLCRRCDRVDPQTHPSAVRHVNAEIRDDNGPWRCPAHCAANPSGLPFCGVIGALDRPCKTAAQTHRDHSAPAHVTPDTWKAQEVAESPYRHKIDQRQRGRHGNSRRKRGGRDRGSGISDSFSPEEELQSPLDELSVGMQTSHATEAASNSGSSSSSSSSSSEDSSPSSINSFSNRDAAGKSQEENEGMNMTGARVESSDELADHMQRRRSLLFQVRNANTGSIGKVPRSTSARGRLLSDEQRDTQRLRNASNAATSTNMREITRSIKRRLSEFLQWPAMSIPQSFDSRLATNPFLDGQPQNDASLSYRHTGSESRPGRESNNFDSVGGGLPFTSWPSNGVAFSVDSEIVNKDTYNGNAIDGNGASADASSSSSTTAAAAWVLNAAMKESNAEQIWAKQSQRGPNSGDSGGSPRNNGRGGGGNTNRRSGNRGSPNKPALSRPMSCSEAVVFLDRNAPPVKCVPYINPRLDATVYGSTVLDGTAPTTIATTTTATGADAAAAKARDRSSSSRRHSSYASTKRAERNSGAPAGSPAITASAAVAPVARPYAGVPVTAHGTHAAVAALHASATAEARAAAMAKAIAGSGAAALDNLGSQGRVWRRRRRRRRRRLSEEATSDGGSTFGSNHTASNLDGNHVRTINSRRDRTSSERRKLEVRTKQQWQQRRRQLLAGRDDSWGMSVVSTSPPRSQQVFTELRSGTEDGGSGSSISSWGDGSSSSGSASFQRSNKKGRHNIHRRSNGGNHGGAAVEEGWALEEHDRGGRGSHRPMPMVLGDDDDAGGAHSMHAGGGGLRGHVERLQDLETEGHANTGSVRGTGSSSSKGSKIQPHVFGAPYRAGWLNASAPHLAICVSGTPKLLTLPKYREHFSAVFLEPLQRPLRDIGGSLDVFLHLDGQQHKRSDLELAVRFLRPKTCQLHTQPPPYLGAECLANGYNAALQQRACLDDIAWTEEHTRKMKYTWVLRVRPDLEYRFAVPPLHEWLDLRKDTVFTAYGPKRPRKLLPAKDDYVDDTFALVPRDLAHIYFEEVANSFETCLPLVPPPPKPSPPPPSLETKEPFRSPFVPSATLPENSDEALKTASHQTLRSGEGSKRSSSNIVNSVKSSSSTTTTTTIMEEGHNTYSKDASSASSLSLLKKQPPPISSKSLQAPPWTWGVHRRRLASDLLAKEYVPYKASSPSSLRVRQDNNTSARLPFVVEKSTFSPRLDEVKSTSILLSRHHPQQQQQHRLQGMKRQRRLQLTEFLRLGSSDGGVSSSRSSSTSSRSSSDTGSSSSSDGDYDSGNGKPSPERLDHGNRNNRGGSHGSNGAKKHKNNNGGVGRGGTGSAESCFTRWRSSECRVEQVLRAARNGTVKVATFPFGGVNVIGCDNAADVFNDASSAAPCVQPVRRSNKFNNNDVAKRSGQPPLLAPCLNMATWPIETKIFV